MLHSAIKLRLSGLIQRSKTGYLTYSCILGRLLFEKKIAKEYRVRNYIFWLRFC